VSLVVKKGRLKCYGYVKHNERERRREEKEGGMCLRCWWKDAPGG